MSLKIGVIGSNGRVGKELLELIQADPSLVAQVGVSRSQSVPGYRYNIQSLKEASSLDVDVWIDFSLPDAHDTILDFCIQAKKPLVSGTTGLSVQQKQRHSSAAHSIPLLWASNMSLGIAVLRQLLPQLAPLVNFDIQVEEFHHNKKKDIPSGTAITLQEDIEKSLNRKLPEIVAVRGGGIFGVHRVYAMSDEETITLEHTALNRRVFARGALTAAKWLAKQKPGFYSMNDVLIGTSFKK